MTSDSTSGAGALAVVGASGYVGRRLVSHLSEGGHEVVALGRNIERLPSIAVRRAVDVADTAALAEVLAGVDTAFYLVHSMAATGDFAARDMVLARSFAQASARAGVRRIVYLGALGTDELSEHLRSRQEVGQALAATGVEVVELRAAVVLGAGSISFEMLRYLTERLPVMICPRWIQTRVQPVAESDLLRYLERAPHVAPGIYEIGCPQPTTYHEMISTYARVRGLKRRVVIDVPALTPRLSAHWVDLVTPVDRKVSHSLIESLTTEVVVASGQATATAFGIAPLDVTDAIRAALDDQLSRVAPGLMGFDSGLRNGIYAMRSSAPLTAGGAAAARRELAQGGGDLRWYGLPRAWQARLRLGRIFGESLRLGRPAALEKGAKLDWWRVEECGGDSFVLQTAAWFCGEAWLGYRVIDEEPRPRLEQVGALRPKGLLGLLYWRALWPAHLVVFRVMVRRMASRARATSGEGGGPTTGDVRR